MLKQVNNIVKISNVKKKYIFKCCFLKIISPGEHLIPSGRVFHSVAAAVFITNATLR